MRAALQSRAATGDNPWLRRPDGAQHCGPGDPAQPWRWTVVAQGAAGAAPRPAGARQRGQAPAARPQCSRFAEDCGCCARGFRGLAGLSCLIRATCCRLLVIGVRRAGGRSQRSEGPSAFRQAGSVAPPLASEILREITEADALQLALAVWHTDFHNTSIARCAIACAGCFVVLLIAGWLFACRSQVLGSTIRVPPRR